MPDSRDTLLTSRFNFLSEVADITNEDDFISELRNLRLSNLIFFFLARVRNLIVERGATTNSRACDNNKESILRSATLPAPTTNTGLFFRSRASG